MENEDILTGETVEESGDVERSIADLCSSLGGDEAETLKVHVYKDSTFNGKVTYPKIWVGPPGEFDINTIIDEYGGGHYKVRVYGRDLERGINVIKLNSQFHWLESKKRQREREKELEQKPDANTSPINFILSRRYSVPFRLRFRRTVARS